MTRVRFLLSFIKQIKKLIDTLRYTFNHEVSRRFDGISHHIETLYGCLRLHILSLSDTIDGPLTTISSHRKDATMFLEDLAKKHTQVRQGKRSFFLDIVALNNLMGNQQVFSSRSQARITIGRLHNAGNTLSIETIHNAFMWNQRDITENMHFETYCLMNIFIVAFCSCRYMREARGCSALCYGTLPQNLRLGHFAIVQ